MKTSEMINPELEKLPVATEVALQRADNGDSIERYKAIFVGSNVVSCVSNNYKLVQHKDAFRPVIEGLTLANCHNFKFDTFSVPRRAFLKIYVDEDKEHGISYGFSVVNSFDGSTAIRYGFSSFELTRTIEVVGWRQVCSNGLKVKVPLDQAEYVTEEERLKLVEIFSKSLRIEHTEKQATDLNFSTVELAVRGMVMLKEPIRRIVEAAKAKVIDGPYEYIEQMIEKFVGKTLKQRVLEEFNKSLRDEREERTLWGLYNAITYVGTHSIDLKESTKENLLNKAADMLENQLGIEPFIPEPVSETQTRL